MIIEISQPDFMSISGNDELDLPRRWDGINFHDTLKSLYEKYDSIISPYINPDDLLKVRTLYNGILKVIEDYHDGFSNRAFNKINLLMKDLFKHPLKIYPKSGLTGVYDDSDPLMLFRIRNVQNNIYYKRKDIFHTPYNMRSKISTCRYSISGYPCLYLATSLDLCIEEAKKSNFNDLTIASRFKIQRNMNCNERTTISVIELALKPKDFLNYDRERIFLNRDSTIGRERKFNELDLHDLEVMGKYLYWYPLIAACSFIRVNKNDPFASEYIIPQLLMQWIRKEQSKNKLIGIRYFSCASERASEWGYNYVFPVSGLKDLEYGQYCKVLYKAFKLTIPVYIHEFNTIGDCEYHLKNSTDFEQI